MGRTVPTFVQLIEQAMAHWLKFRRALRREDQQYFDKIFRRVRWYTQAATYQCNDSPMEAILLSIALDQEKRLDSLERAAGHAGQKVEFRETAGMDFRSLPERTGDEAVDDHAESDTPPAD
jgi:hypothetical protein